MIGTLLLPAAGVRLEPGGSVRARLNTENGGARSVSLLITLATSPRDYGRRQAYRVRVDGQEVYSASEHDAGGGFTRSFFLDLPEPRRAAIIEISADLSSQAPVIVSSLRCYERLASPDPKSKIQNPKSKMALALLTPKGFGYSLDAATMREAYLKLPRSPYLERQLAVLYNFCVRSAAENAAEINRLAGLAAETGIPLRIAFQFHWGGIPRGVPDGAGGAFTDLPYQQITYDPDDRVDDPGLAALMGDRYDVRFGLSIPNVWSNTPWLTFNHPRLNQFRRIRLTYALAAWRAARERLKAAGKGNLLPPELSTGEETIYWAKGVEDKKYTELNGGKPRAHLMADFNPFVVADAQRDRVNLDPRDGLDYTERWWLHQNLGRWQQKIIDWMQEALPAEPVMSGRPQPIFAADLVRRNLYTEPYAMPCYPMKEVSAFHPGLEVGFVRDGRSGGEYWSGAAMLPWLLKERERGRIALPNLECTGANDEQLVACLRAAYACGARFATLYNWHYRSNIADLLKAFTDSIEGNLRFTIYDLRLEPAIENPKSRIENSREYVAPPGAFGVNRIDLFPVPGFTRPVPVRVTLRDADPARADSVSVTTTLTPSSSSLTPSVVYLPTLFPQEPGRRYALTVESAGAPSPNLLPASAGRFAARLTADIAFERARSLAIEDWQDAADLLSSLRERHAHSDQSRYAKEALEEAERLFSANRPQDAYRAAIRAEQLSLPAASDLPTPGGRLAPYWITVLCPAGPVRAVITTYADRMAVVSIRSAVTQTVTVRWGGFETTAALSPDIPAEITLDLGPRKPMRPRTRRRASP
jgi:hypothetical protein